MCGGNATSAAFTRSSPGPSPRVRGKQAVLRRVITRDGSIPACAGETTRRGQTLGLRRVHPRVCGGNHLAAVPSGRGAGPSPRVRGKPLLVLGSRRDGRSIPACAGETGGAPCSWSRCGVHPRVCGGNRGAVASLELPSGPSPRVRGKLSRARWTALSIGSIPACAGETRAARWRTGSGRVHPRVCGGNSTTSAGGSAGFGPSPRVRGKPIVNRIFLVPDGSIPACAGETSRVMVLLSALMVHPRVCGGNRGRVGSSALAGGPSPRVRGKRLSASGWTARRRSIPACAGETPQTIGGTRDGTVHPRVCGGNRARGRGPSGGAGPSPRVRGKQVVVLRVIDEPGSIPACAGETEKAVKRPNAPAVHPRVCGGNSLWLGIRTEVAGPSPRVRGKLLRQDGDPLGRGSIPACAGEHHGSQPREPRHRSIPACAGETACSASVLSAVPVHPRVCGGNSVPRRLVVERRGPSPRVRGKRSMGIRRCGSWRSIPACAGETFPSVSSRRGVGVHPRVCGGNGESVIRLIVGPGPSPRVRGKRPCIDRACYLGGSIPACAGETRTARHVDRICRVHPRVCGGNLAGSLRRSPEPGPSPRVRGKPIRILAGIGILRSIPACAGETRTRVSSAGGARVHPRVCGGNALGIGRVGSGFGPSPRVRGKRPHGRGVGGRLRSIPACAGETPAPRLSRPA